MPSRTPTEARNARHELVEPVHWEAVRTGAAKRCSPDLSAERRGEAAHVLRRLPRMLDSF